MAFMDSLEKLTQKVSSILDGGTVGAVVEIGKDILDLIDNAKEVVDETDADKLTMLRDELEPKVMAHADKTENTLRGED